MRALLTWLAIFPLVAVVMAFIAPLSEGWHPVLRAFTLTLVVVPLAVYFVVPRLFQGYGMLRRRRMSK
jgi:antibiotic biosynthesis monooxygenase (ABM) superfamily enzyme